MALGVKKDQALGQVAKAERENPTIDSVHLKVVKKEKNLGVIIDKNFKFCEQSAAAIKKRTKCYELFNVGLKVKIELMTS